MSDLYGISQGLILPVTTSQVAICPFQAVFKGEWVFNLLKTCIYIHDHM